MADSPQFPPENYYRVSIKALIFDDKQRLLVFQDNEDKWEMPGGGWDHAEDYKTCITRELDEEVGARVAGVGPLAFFYRCESQHGHPKVSIAVLVTLHATDFTSYGDNIVATRFVAKEEFVQLPFQKGEASVQQHADEIWQAVEKSGQNK